MQEGMGEVMMKTFEAALGEAVVIMTVMPYFKTLTGRLSGYLANPSRSQSSPWSTPDYFRKWHPFDALLAERRAILAGERAALDAAGKKDAAWWREVGRG